jgi:hypothetical protein
VKERNKRERKGNVLDRTIKGENEANVKERKLKGKKREYKIEEQKM